MKFGGVRVCMLNALFYHICFASSIINYFVSIVFFKGLIQGHAFASGNRRTAFIATKYFLVMNNRKLGVKDNPENAKVMLGIRENYYSDGEIKEWIKNGRIKKFKR